MSGHICVARILEDNKRISRMESLSQQSLPFKYCLSLPAAALSGWDSVRLCRAGLFHLLSPPTHTHTHAQQRRRSRCRLAQGFISPEGSSLLLHLLALVKKEALSNSVLHIPFLLFTKTQEQLGKGDEGLSFWQVLENEILCTCVWSY